MRKPNIVLILGDDIGYSDISPFGSEIKTPNLDRLSNEGLRFANFYNMSKCEPSRSSLFTGLYNGNEGAINLSQILRNEGYYTIHSGKEHFMDWVPEHVYAENCFDQSLTFWAMNEFFEPPSGEFANPFSLNGEKVNIADIYHKKTPFFKTDALTDNALKWLEEPIRKKQPFFLYLGYGAAHYPLQARPEDIDKYRGRYKIGWDKVREQRHKRLSEMGLIPEGTILSSPSSNINKFRGHPDGNNKIREKIPLYRPWDKLSETEKDELDLEMAVFAAMVDCMDHNIGRVLQKLDEEGLAENTIVIYLSDNGSCPYDSNRDFNFPPGVAEGFRTLCAAWANAGNTPYRYFKQYGHEGGPHTHFIIRWPKKIIPGQIIHQQGHIVDLYPTILEAAGIKYPENINGFQTLPIHGKSLIPILEGGKMDESDFYISGWTDRFRMYRKGDWKIVKLNNENWELYHLKMDPTEMNELSGKFPEKLQEMIELYNSDKIRTGY